MFDNIEICWGCEHYRINDTAPMTVVLQRCSKCLILGCEHHRQNNECITNLKSCFEREKDKVLDVWSKEVIKTGICVYYSRYSGVAFDKCCEYLDRTKNDEWTCRYCEKNIGKVPFPTSCAGCGGHSGDPDCPLHGEMVRRE